MHRVLFASILLLTTLFNRSTPATAAQGQAQLSSQPFSRVLCLPGIYLYDPGDCVPTGPSSYLTRLAEKGITLPIPPLSAAPIDPALSQVNVRYGEVRTPNAPVYGSLEDAVNHNKKSAVQRLNGSTVYISYVQEEIVNGKRFYMIDFGAWMTSNDVSRIGVLPRSLGMTFNLTPNKPFGWVLNYFAPGPIETKRTPGWEIQDYTGHILNLYDIVWVFAEEQVGDEIWYLIAPDEWVVQKYVARVIPNTTPPEGISGDRWIEVNLFDQTMAVYDQRQMVFATLIASGGEPFWTQPGVFQIYDKLDSTVMRGAFSADFADAYYLEDVPWTMYYDQARALHGAYWRTKMGFEQSHGCVNIAVGDAHWLFIWAQLGEWVYVWDPSGRTPTDPSLYGAGGY